MISILNKWEWCLNKPHKQERVEMKYWLFLMVAVLLGVIIAAPKGDLCVGKGGGERVGVAAHAAGAFANMMAKLDAELAGLGTSRKEVLSYVAKHPLKTTVYVPEYKVFPEHKRRRIMALPPAVEVVIASNYIAKMKSEGRLYEDAKDMDRVLSIVNRIVAVLPEKIPVKVYLDKDETLNAYCLPDGTITVHKGALLQLKDDSLLAAVIAHEYGHAVAHHGNERLSRVLKWTAGDAVVEEMCQAFANKIGSKNVSLVNAAYGLGKGVGIMLPKSRKAELEADRLSVLFLQRAGYNPEAAVRLFEFFASLEKGMPKQDKMTIYFSTHPANADRVANAQEALKKLEQMEGK